MKNVARQNEFGKYDGIFILFWTTWFIFEREVRQIGKWLLGFANLICFIKEKKSHSNWVLDIDDIIAQIWVVFWFCWIELFLFECCSIFSNFTNEILKIFRFRSFFFYELFTKVEIQIWYLQKFKHRLHVLSLSCKVNVMWNIFCGSYETKLLSSTLLYQARKSFEIFITSGFFLFQRHSFFEKNRL